MIAWLAGVIWNPAFGAGLEDAPLVRQPVPWKFERAWRGGCWPRFALGSVVVVNRPADGLTHWAVIACWRWQGCPARTAVAGCAQPRGNDFDWLAAGLVLATSACPPHWAPGLRPLWSASPFLAEELTGALS